ncbi:nucleotidyltransferase [Puia sp.]|jgi:predicted nucleotidyltransferase|uniref:nucleotidyltransferase n=1 Tax=Puia sp. TaxID=2045100 RepID=UPI002F3EA171
MDILDDELIKFWKILNENGVRYIMVGGFAIRFHGFNRSTDDLDMWLEDTIANRKHLRKAFSELGYGDYVSLETMQFVPGWTSFYIGGGIELDIMTAMKGLENITFAECLEMASVADLEGAKVPFLHINHLIANKKIVNRPKDQVDVIELEKIRVIREKSN